MPLRKIEDSKWGKIPCTSSEHNPPSHMVYQPGEYEWTCPACGEKQIFVVPAILF